MEVARVTVMPKVSLVFYLINSFLDFLLILFYFETLTLLLFPCVCPTCLIVFTCIVYSSICSSL